MSKYISDNFLYASITAKYSTLILSNQKFRKIIIRIARKKLAFSEKHDIISIVVNVFMFYPFITFFHLFCFIPFPKSSFLGKRAFRCSKGFCFQNLEGTKRKLLSPASVQAFAPHIGVFSLPPVEAFFITFFGVPKSFSPARGFFIAQNMI